MPTKDPENSPPSENEFVGAFLIPAYNPGELLGRVLTSLIDAKEKAGLSSVPLIVVDDGSTDETFTSSAFLRF
jgi:hypothetical protein